MKYWIIAFIFNVFAGFSQPVQKFEFPRTRSSDTVIEHTGYAFLYNEKHEQSSWVAYELTKAEVQKAFERTDKFAPDPKVSTGTASGRDYEKSGYDRGHLAPAADMSWSAEAMRESFYYSNISPQEPGFNRGIWKKLETVTRSWAEASGAIYIVTGPVLKDGLPTIGPGEVSVPEYYFKVILDYTPGKRKGIGFIMSNKASAQQPAAFAVSIDSVEKFTGLDFFPGFSREEEIIEATLCVKCWDWTIEKTTKPLIEEKAASPAKPASKQVTGATLCTGKTQSGSRCKNKTTSASGRCHLHPL